MQLEIKLEAKQECCSNIIRINLKFQLNLRFFTAANAAAADG